jgi:hypothetical protein
MNKQELRKGLTQDIQAFLAKGGAVKKIALGVSRKKLDEASSKVDYSALP